MSITIMLCCAGCVPTSTVGTLNWIGDESGEAILPNSVVLAEVPPNRIGEGSEDDEMVMSDSQLLQVGEQLFITNCASCHESNGEGNLNRFPPLNDSPLVTAQMPAPLIETVLYGRREMPAFSPTLSNVEAAAVLSYIRQAWGNQAAMIQPDQIQEVRQQREP
jgi:mono/diheme cytochrome c family protein